MAQSIPHLSDLPPEEALAVLRDLPRSVTTEKLDGAAMTVGVDEDGRLFASREGKRPGSPRRYAASEWPALGTNNQFRAAHAALEARADDVRAALRPGETAELEVMLGDQPNTVALGEGKGNRIAVLPGAAGDRLAQALGGSDAVANWDELYTPDGRELETRGATTRFRFEAPRRLDAGKVAAVAAEGEAALSKFLGEPSPVEGLTNLQLLDQNLGSVPQERREEAGVARDAAAAQLRAEHLEPLTRALLAALGADGEGAVIAGPDGRLTKLVDRDGFTAANQAAQAHLAAVRAPIRSTDPEAAADQRGGLIGQLRLDLADMLGNRDLARPAGARAALEPHGPDPVEALKGLAAELDLPDYQGLRQAAAHKVRATAAELEASRRRVLEEPPPDLTEPQTARVLLAHAEARRDLAELLRRLGSAPTASDFLAALYGREAKAAAPVTEAKAKSGAKGEVDQGSYAGLNSDALVWTYVAAALATALVIHEQDKLGLRIARDRKNAGLTRWSTDMSPLNHWGYAIWRATTPGAKKLADDRALAVISRATKSIPRRWWHNLHMDLSYGTDVKIEWDEHRRTLLRLVDLAGARTQRVNSLIDRVIGWPQLALDERVRAFNALYQFALQFIPRSALFARLRALAPDVLTDPAPETIPVTKTNLLAVLEDAAATATAAADIAPVPTGIGQVTRGPMTVRRKRSPDAALLRRQFVDPRKATKVAEATGDAAQALRQADGTDAGSSDLAQKTGGEVAFSATRNAINADGGVTGADVIDYLERAAELNNEVDTVGFVVKDSAGQNVEVYVNAKDADKFATEMADLMGRDDDVEAALNDVAQRVDIVDVVWPKADDPRNDPDPQPEDLDLDAALDPTDETEPPTERAAKVAAAVPAGAADVLRALAAAAVREGLDADDHEPFASLTAAQAAKVDAAFLDKTGVEITAATDQQLDDFVARASSDPRWTQAQTDYVLDFRGQAPDAGRVAEAREPVTAAQALAKIKALVDLSTDGGRADLVAAHLDDADYVLLQLFSSFRDGFPPAKEVRAAAKPELDAQVTRGVGPNTREIALRLANPVDKDELRAGLAKLVADHGAELHEGESRPARLTDAECAELLELFKAWSGGDLPGESTKSEIDAFIEEALPGKFDEDAAHAYLHAHNVHLGEQSPAQPENPMSKTPLSASFLARIGTEAVTEAVDVGTDDFAEAVVALVSALGVPDANLTYRRAQLVQALRAKKNSLTNRATIVSRAKALVALIQQGTRDTGAAAPTASEE